MEIGSLFFALGFKGTGAQELNKYETAIDGAQGAALALQNTWDDMLYLMEKMAVKMGALTAEELDLHKADMALMKQAKEARPVEQQQIRDLDKKNSLLSQAHQKLVSLVGKMNAYKIELYGSGAALVYFTKRMSDMAIHLDKAATLTGIPLDKMQKLGEIANQTGASLDDVAGAVRNFQENSMNIMLGKGGEIGAFQMLGLSPHEDPIKMLSLLQDKLKAMPTVLGNKLAKDIGLSDDLIYMLRNADKFEAPPEETFLTEKEVRRLKEFGFYFNKVFGQVQRVFSKLASTVEPFVRLLLYGLERIVQMFGKLINSVEPFQDTIMSILKVLAVMAGAAFAYVSPWIAAFSALLLVFEDLYSYTKGDKSFTGWLIKQFSDINNAIDLAVASLGTFFSMLLTIPAYLAGGKEGVAKLDDTIGDIVASMSGGLKSMIGKSPAPAGAAGALGSSEVTNNNNITINGAGDPVKTGKAVVEAISRQNSDAVYQQPQTGR